MTATYNPIVREFGRLRAGIIHAAGVSRRAVRPDSLLADLVPIRSRREVWRGLQAEGIDVPDLRLPRRAASLVMGAVVVATLATALGTWSWWGLLAVFPLGWLMALVSRPWATEFSLGLRTVGELTLFVTRFADHRASGYRWTPNEIRLKVRMVVSKHLAVDFDRVRLDSSFIEDLGAD